MSSGLEVIREDMQFADLQNIINQAISMQGLQLSREVAELKGEQEKMKEEMAIDRLENESLRKVQLKEHRVKEHRFGFVGLGDLGQIFTVSIGAKTIGKLLRIAGLAKINQTKTEPLRSAIVNNYAKSFMYGDYPSYSWNPERCINKIERWLDKEGILDEFYAIEDEKKLMEYINNLFEIYNAEN